MKNVIIRLWPSEPIPKSYFGLVRRLVDAVPRIDAAKRSACIEGARMAFARVKTFWGKMKAWSSPDEFLDLPKSSSDAA